ncbi:hypothetical protein D0N36_13650 [Hymenobacter lapidiphilus]|nr:hypothetical protein D0N36_13650 [Hymenobacter sp. CCM 8763]
MGIIVEYFSTALLLQQLKQFERSRYYRFIIEPAVPIEVQPIVDVIDGNGQDRCVVKDAVGHYKQGVVAGVRPQPRWVRAGLGHGHANLQWMQKATNKPFCAILAYSRPI